MTEKQVGTPRSGAKTLLLLLLALALILAPLAACGENGPPVGPNDHPGEYNGDDYNGGDSWAGIVARPTGRTVPFQQIEPSFVTNDDDIVMIEINQSLSYGFDTDTGDFYTMEAFAAGKETGIFVQVTEAFGYDYGGATLTVERDGVFIAELIPADLLGDTLDLHTIHFQPKNIADVGNWGQGAYTFTFTLGESQAVRTTNFYETMSMRILAVPIVANYSGQVVRCEGEWQTGGTMITAVFPLARDSIEYVLGAELDLSDDHYDLDTDEGQYYVWEALSNLQTPNKDYTLIIGYVRENVGHGTTLGYTMGLPASVVVESSPDMLATVVHEIAHCYNIGDEYEGGHINTAINAPPYQMEGYDIVTRTPAVAMKQKVVGGPDMGLEGTGSVIY